jgi:hypothetical protein
MQRLGRLGAWSVIAALSLVAQPAWANRTPRSKAPSSASVKKKSEKKSEKKSGSEPEKKLEKASETSSKAGKKKTERTAKGPPEKLALPEKKRAEAKAQAPARTAKTSPRARAEPDAPVPSSKANLRPGNRYLNIPAPAVAESTPAFRYANLSDEGALAELTRRGIPFVPARPPLPGVRTPIRLTGPLHGVTIRSTLPPAERRTTPFEILDARLALALDDFCALLARHDIVELVHFTIYRPPGELPPNFGGPLTRHPGGLAIDLGAVRKRDGNLLAVGPHWPSNIGAKTCGEGAEELRERPGRELISIVCEANDEGLFHYMLTPRFDSAHGDHVHLEIKPDTRWFLVN